MSIGKSRQSGFSPIFIILIVIAVIAAASFIFRPKPEGVNGPPKENQSIGVKKGKELWKETGVIIPGKYADADIIDTGNGKYRMYYSAEPETPGFNGQVYSATSTDGVAWTKEEGVRITSAIFPSVIKLADGKYRMYFQEGSVIKSAISPDGLTFTREGGIRIDASAPGVTLSKVLSPTVIKTGEKYLMVYVGEINEEYKEEKVPNKIMHLLLWATSDDGLTFEKKGIAIDSRNSQLKGWLEGPDLVEWDGKIKLFGWSYTGIYESSFEKNSFSQPLFVFLGPNAEANTPFPLNPPADPTVLKIGNTWNLYYGYHTKGIYRAVLK